MAEEPLTPAPALSAPAVQPVPLVAPGEVGNPADATTALYRAIVGPVQTDYYLAVFTRMDDSEHKRPYWNWAACLFTFSWLVFRKLWSASLYYAGGVVAGFLMIFGIGRLVFHFSVASELMLAGTFIGMLYAVPGLLGNALLHSDCRRRMTLALRSSDTDEEARLVLVGQASTRRRLWVLLGLNLLLAALLGLGAWQWMQFSATAGSLAHPIVNEVASVASDPGAATPMPQAPGTPPANAVSAPLEASISAPVTAPPTVVASQPSMSVATSPRPVTGTAGRSATGPVPWETMQVAPPRPDAVRPPAIEPKKHSIDPPWSGKPDTPPGSAKAMPAQPQGPTKVSNEAATHKKLLINIGLFAIEENARNAHQKLQGVGLPATLQPLNTAKGPRFRVRVGPYDDRREADKAVETIRAMSLEALIIDAP